MPYEKRTDPTRRTDESSAKAPITRRDLLRTGGAGLGGLAVFGGVSGVSAASNAIETPRLSTEGNWLVDPDGNQVVLRGVNVEDPYWAHHYDDKEISTKMEEATSGDWYARVIRLPCEQKWIPSAGGVQSYVDTYVDPLVDKAEQLGVYLILDWHEIDRWDDSTVHNNLTTFWDYVAPRYADREHVLYELFNEPTAPGGGSLDNWRAWRDTAQPWVDSIRADAPETPIIIGSPRYCQLTKHADDAPFEGNDLIYAAHVYPYHFHNSVDMTALAETASNVPLIMSEWGYENDEDRSEHMIGTTSGYGQGMKDWFADNANVGWTPWCYSRQYAPRMWDDDWNLRGGEDYQGEYIKNFLDEKRNDNVPGQGYDDDTAPTAPSNLSSPAADGSSVDLEWEAATDEGGSGLNYYNVYVDGTKDHQVAASTTSTTADGLWSNRDYDFHVTAVDVAGNESNPSSTITVSTGDPTGPIISRASKTPLIDGTSGRAWENVQLLTLSNDLQGEPPADDLFATASTLYDTENLYVLVEVIDDEKPGQDSDVIYQDDSIEVYLDVGNDKNRSYGSDDYQYQFRRDGSAFAETKHAATAGVEWTTTETSDGYTLEIAFPHSTTGVDPIHGAKLGFDVHVVDDDDGGNRDHKITWSDTDDDAWQDPSAFGTLTYVDTSTDNGPSPAPPSNLSSSDQEKTSIDLDWDPSPHPSARASDTAKSKGNRGNWLDHYNVYVDGENTTEADSTSTTVSDLSPGMSYDIQVTAVHRSGRESDRSAPITVTTDFGGRTGNINSTAVSPEIDGTRDSFWDGAETLSLDNVLIGSPSASSLDATASTLYDANSIYVLVEVTDDADSQDSDAIYQDDTIEVYLDVGKDNETSYGSDDYQYQFRRDGSAFAETKHAATNGISWASTETSDGYTLEIAFPHVTTGANPSDGGFLGFDVHVVDDDDGGNRDHKIAWSATSDNAWQDPSAFGTLTYSDVGNGDGDTTAPTAPANLSSPSQTDESVDLDWDASSDDGDGVDHYNVYVDGTRDHEVAAGTTDTTVDGLSVDTNYDFHVTAVDSPGNESSPSSTVTVTTASRGDGDDGGPTPPANLSSPSQTDTTIDLDWDPTNYESDLDHYTVFTNGNASFYVPSNTSPTLTGLSSGTSYDIYVVAVDNDGNVSDQSNTITVTTGGSSDDDDDTDSGDDSDGGPSAPANLSSPSQSSSTIDLDWDPTNDAADLDHYTVFANGNASYYVPSNTSPTLTGLSSGTSYDIYVVAVDNDGNVSDPSNTITVSTDSK